MLHKNTQLNMLYLMHDIGYAYPDQIIRFFRDAPDAKNVPYYIKKQIDARNFFWASSASGLPMESDAAKDFTLGFREAMAAGTSSSFFATHTNVLMFRKTPELKTDVLRRRLHALWVLASFESDEVRQVYLAKYPSQIMFITEDNQCYEVTCCYDTTTAQLAMSVRQSGIPKGMNDEVNHIALISHPNFAKDLQPYGFDSFCYLDKNHNPQYGVWE